MQLFDSHCHLDFDEFKEDRAEVITAAVQAGVQKLLVPAVTVQTWSRLLAFVGSRQPLELYGALGLHPFFISEHKLQHLQTLEEVLSCRDERIVGVGEIGLDLWPGVAAVDQQRELFKAQLAIAKNHQLPVILHVRKAHDEVLKLLRALKLSRGGIVHAFSGSQQQAQQYIELGFVLGVGGAVTHERARKLQKTVAALPDYGIVLETDAPDMAPAFVRGLRNEPKYLQGIAEFIATLRRQEPAQMASTCFANSCRILGI